MSPRYFNTMVARHKSNFASSLRNSASQMPETDYQMLRIKKNFVTKLYCYAKRFSFFTFPLLIEVVVCLYFSFLLKN